MTTPCPSDDQLAALASGTLNGVALEEIEKHVDGCPTCRQLVAVVSNGSAPTLKHTLSVLKPGERLGRYEIERLIGAGGMGVLYVARDPQLGRRVALKLMRPAFGTEGGRVRLLREAQAMATLSHANVVNVFDIGEADERVFVAMELMEGGTLREWMKQPHSWRELVEMFCAAGEGLAAAHAAGVVHRDFKPENVLIGKDGRPRVGDFGLARPELVAEEEAPISQVPMRVTQTGTMLGTPAYMSPEQLKGRPADHRSDQYGFCVCLYEALAGQRPFPADTLEELRARVEGGMPPPPKDGLVPAHVWAAIARGLNPDPNERFPDLQSLLRVLRADLPVPARSSGRASRAPRIAAIGGLMAVAIGVGVAFRPASKPAVVEKAPYHVGPVNELPDAITIAQGHQLVFDVDGIERVEVEQSGVIDAHLIGINTELLVTGKETGATTLTTVGADGSRREVTVKVIDEPKEMPPEQPNAPIPNVVMLAVGSQKVIKIPQLRSYELGDRHVVMVRPIADEPDSLLFVGSTVGLTTLTVWTKDGRRWVSEINIGDASEEAPLEPSEYYALRVGGQKVVSFRGVTKVVVDEPSIVDAELLGNEQVHFTAKDVGTSTFTLTLGDGSLVRGTVEVEQPEPTYSGAPNLLVTNVALSTSQSKVFDVPGLTRVAIGDPTVCEIRTLGESQLMLLGGAEGVTTLLVWTSDGKRISSTVKVSRASAPPPPLKHVAGSPFDTVTPLSVGQQVVFDVPKVTTVAIGDPALGDVKTLEGDQILLVANETGTTTLWVWTSDGHRYSTELAINREDPQSVTLSVGDDELIPFSHIERVKGVDPALAEVSRDGNSLRITGKKKGELNLQVFTGLGAPIAVNVRVMPAVRELERERLTLGTKDLVQFHLAGLERIAIGDPNIADVKLLDDERIEVHGVSRGKTTLLAWMTSGQRRSWEIEVR